MRGSHRVNHELIDLVANLEKLPRIRHVIKNQKVIVRLCKKHEDAQFSLKYAEPSK
jgi:hypothetical protein